MYDIYIYILAHRTYYINIVKVHIFIKYLQAKINFLQFIVIKFTFELKNIQSLNH